MASIHSILLFSSLAISFFLFANPVSSAATPETQELIDKICRQMEDYGFCNQVFQHWLRAPSSGLVDLTQITLETTTENASNNFMFVQAMRDHSTDPNGKSALEECMSQYEVITDAFTEAIRLFTAKDYTGMLNRERPTPKSLALCQDRLNPRLSDTAYSPLVERNRQQRILITMSIVTAHLLTLK